MVSPSLVAERYVAMVLFPASNPGFIPSLIPLFLGLLVMSLYFGRHPFERLGWNSAVSNAALLLTTGVTLLLELGVLPGFGTARAAVATGILGLGAVILLLNFFHVWPAEVAFNVSSAFTTYTAAYVTIATVYTGLPMDRSTAAAAVLTGFTFYLVTHTLKKLARPHPEDGTLQYADI